METIYLAIENFEVDSASDYYEYVKTHCVSRKIYENLEESLELIFQDNKLIRINRTFHGELNEKILSDIEVNLNYKEFKENKIYKLQFDENGFHQLGGEVPSDLIMPANKLQVPMQYIGKISNSDPIFNWLPSDLQIIFPNFLTFDKLYLDYEEVFKPKIINVNELERANSEFEDLNENTEIVYNKVNFNFIENQKFNTSFGSGGIPNWIAWPEIPKCPKTGEYMKFVCQLHEGTYVKRHNINLTDEGYSHYFHKLDFWNSGDLFVFFNPNSKTACLFIADS